MPLNSLKPECRMLLLSLLDKYSIENTFCISISDMEKEFFTTRNVITDLFTYLKNNDYVATEREFTLRGRGRYIYTFMNSLATVLEQDSLLSKAYKSNDLMVQKIIRNELQEITISLRSSHRLFILILVIHADQMGRVSNLSSSNIRQMMGSISADRFKSQMRKLASLKLLSGYIAGLTSKKLFGKITSTYFLNLNHPIFLDWLPNVSSIYIEAQDLIYIGVNQCSEANALILFFKSKNNGGLYPVLAPFKNILNREAIEFFLGKYNEHDNLQLRLFNIASLALSYSWEGNKKINIESLSEDQKRSHKIMDLFEWDKVLSEYEYDLLNKLAVNSNLLYFERIEKTLDDADIDDNTKLDISKKYCSLIYMLFLLSLSIANRYKAILMKIVGNDFHIKKFCLIPKQKVETECSEYEMRYIATAANKKRLNLSFKDKNLQCEKGNNYCLVDEFIEYIQPQYDFNEYLKVDE